MKVVQSSRAGTKGPSGMRVGVTEERQNYDYDDLDGIDLLKYIYL